MRLTEIGIFIMDTDLMGKMWCGLDGQVEGKAEMQVDG